MPEPRPAATRNTSGRVTRSSAVLDPLVLNPDDGDQDSISRASAAVQPHRLKRATSAVGLATRKSKRTRHHSGYYGESSDEDEDNNAYLSPNTDGEARAPAPTTPTRNRRPQAKPTGSTPRTKRTPKGTLKTGEPVAPTLELGVIPPWSELPYFILVQIFESAAPTPLDWASVRWLLAMSRICRAFAEPALTVLYKSPPLLSPAMTHSLLDSLASQPDSTLFNYRQKIEKLEIDVGSVVTKTYRGVQLDLRALVQYLPRLMEVNLWHQKDNAPYRELDDNLKWHYPPQLFEGLGVQIGPDGVVSRSTEEDARFAKLRSWRWSSRMLGPNMKLDSLRDLHSAPCFVGLRKVAFVNFQMPSLHAANPEDPDVMERDRSFVTRLGESISALPELTHLVIESSTAVTEQLLPLLPKTIQHLELVNCWDIGAEDVAEYLLSHGSALRHLTLHHNQSLSLAFLPVLGIACPNLRSLSMNLTYFNHHAFYRDSDPCYDALLAPGQIPTWPPALQHLELKNLRKWDADAAENFFQSLVDGAANLPMLRHLDIKAMLDIPFRQRSQMRDKWVAKLNEVFLRKWEDPLPFHSLRSREDEEPSEIRTPSKKQRKPSAGSLSSARRSHRIATQIPSSSSRASSVGRDLRIAGGRPSYAEPDTDEDFDSLGNDDDEDDARDQSSGAEHKPLSPETEVGSFVQGMCNIVDIRFDNQKPVEHQWHMEDFLDSESDNPADEDWNGDRDIDDDYAW